MKMDSVNQHVVCLSITGGVEVKGLYNPLERLFEPALLLNIGLTTTTEHMVADPEYPQ